MLTRLGSHQCESGSQQESWRRRGCVSSSAAWLPWLIFALDTCLVVLSPLLLCLPVQIPQLPSPSHTICFPQFAGAKFVSSLCQVCVKFFRCSVSSVSGCRFLR